MISESPFTAVFGAVSVDQSVEDSLIHVARAAVRQGFAIVPNRPGTKQPLCTLNAKETREADDVARAQAQERGDRRWDRVRHSCGVHHAITSDKDSDRIVRRLVKTYGRINLGIELRRSRVVVVDVDTPAENAAFLATWRAHTDEPAPAGYTISSPGVRDETGAWIHSGGGHYYFTLPETLKTGLPPVPGGLKDDSGWAAMWADRQVLVPPSVRTEGPYRLTGEPRPVPHWLLKKIVDHVLVYRERKDEQERRAQEREAAGAGEASVDTWSAAVPWPDLLEPEGWVDTGDATNCGCSEWTAPGSHANPKSATAHEPGCADTRYDDSPGHLPIHIWTDNPPPPLDGGRTYSKLQFTALMTHGSAEPAAIAQTCRDLGIDREGGRGGSLTPLAVTGLLSRTTPPTPSPEPATAPEHTANGDGGTHPVPVSPTSSPIPPPHADLLPDPASTAAEDAVAQELARRIARHLAEQQFERDYAAELDELERTRAHRRQEANDHARAELANQRAGTASFEDELYDESDLDEMPELEPLVHGWFNKDSDVRVYGPSGHGKSFTVLDWALCIASGTPWHGVPVEQGKVLYIAGEGARGVKKRIRSWRQRYGGSPIRGQFTVKGRPVQLSAPEQLISAAEENQYALVIIDTQARSTVGLEENSASDTAIVTEAMRRIRQAGGKTTVMLVHHTGKDEDAGARGSSAGTAAVDTEIRVTKKNAVISLLLEKQKDGPDGTTRDFALTAVPETDSCVLVPLDPMVAASQKEDRARPLTPLTGVPILNLPQQAGVEEAANWFRELYSIDPSAGYTKIQVMELMRGSETNRRKKDTLSARGRRAFLELRGAGFIVPADDNLSGREEGKHRWRGADDTGLSGDDKPDDSVTTNDHGKTTTAGQRDDRVTTNDDNDLDDK